MEPAWPSVFKAVKNVDDVGTAFLDLDLDLDLAAAAVEVDHILNNERRNI